MKILFVIYCYLLFSCGVTRSYTYTLCVQTKSSSRLVVNKKVGIADTTASFLRGKIVDESGLGPLIGVNIILTNCDTKEKVNTTTDSNGAYEMAFKSGKYNAEFLYPTYGDLQVDSLEFKTGEIRKMDIELGDDGGAFVMYEIDSKRKLSKKEIEAMEEKLSRP